jgi:hypothetical protein
VVAHSLGGLVARHWVAVRQGWRHCVALLTLGTPHRGAPKALDWLVNGAGAGPLRLRRVTEVIQGWPSVYELLPQYAAVWDAASEKEFELVELPGSVLSVRQDLTGYAERFATMAQRARRVHEEIRTGWAELGPDRAPAVIPYHARGHATPHLVTLDGGRLRVSKKDPRWRGNVGWRGDGTVPALCAIPPELGERRHRHVWRVVPDRHGPIGSTPDLVEVLRSYAGEPVPTRGELPDRPWLGLDLDDFALTGQPVPVAATLLPAPLAATRAGVTVTALDDVVPVHRDRLHLAGAGEGGEQTWRGELPPLPAGAYEVAVEVLDVPGVESVAYADTLVVLDRATVDADEG